MTGLVGLAARNVARYARHYVFLLAGLTVGVAILVAMSALFAAMIFNTTQKAAVYYGGDATLIGYFPIRLADGTMSRGRSDIQDPALIEKICQEVLGDQVIVSPRRSHRDGEIRLYFQGRSLRQRVIQGVRFGAEAKLLARLGADPAMLARLDGQAAIYMSRFAADDLGVRVGDTLVLQANTISGQVNTMELVVGELFEDTSLFSISTVYMDVNRLNQLISDRETYYSDMCISLPGRQLDNGDLNRLAAAFGTRIPFFGRLMEKEEGWEDRFLSSQVWDDQKYLLVGLEAHLSLISDRVFVLQVVSALLGLVLLLIMVLGIFNTFRLLVYERYREIGTLRALGMKRLQVRLVFVTESLLMAALGFGWGIILSLGILQLVAQLDFSALYGFEVFLESRVLRGRVDWLQILELGGLVVLASLAGVWGPAARASRVQPVQALRKE